MSDFAHTKTSSSAFQIRISQHLSQPSMQKTIVALIAVSLLAFLAYSFDLKEVVEIVSRLNPTAFVLVLVAMMGALAVSCLRYQTIIKSMGIKVPREVAFRANLLGIVGGMLFFQLAGQTISRAAILRSYGVTAAEVFLANIYERLSAAFWLAGLALISAFVLFGDIKIDLAGGGNAMIRLVLLLAIAFAATGLVACRHMIAVPLRRLNIGRFARAFTIISASTIIAHVFTLLAYVHLASIVAPSADLIDIFAASAVIMFAASIPISFAGWGVREISAVYAYGAIGMSPEQALTISVTIGLLSLLLLVGMSLTTLATGIKSTRNTPHVVATRTNTGALNIDRLLCWVLPILAGILLFFQVHVPAGPGNLNVNLADPVVIAAGILFLVHYIRLPDRTKIWRMASFEKLIILATLSIGLAFAIGVARIGVTDWALYNRMLGWFILLGYCASGALIVFAAGEAGRKTLFVSLMTVGGVLLIFDYLVFWLSLLNFPIHEFVRLDQFRGMSQNSNAFAFQLLVLLGLVLAILPNRSSGQTERRTNYLQMSLSILFLAGIIYTQSRAGLVVAACLCIAAVTLRWISLSRAAAISAGVLCIYLLPALVAEIQSVSNYLMAAKPEMPVQADLAIEMTRVGSDSEHWFSITRALELWREHPLLGAGLGSFVTTVQAEKDIQLVIHNTALWLLAEFGLVGLILFAAMFAMIFVAAWKPALAGSSSARALILLLLVFAVFQLAHDVFYQRIFWFVLGALLVQGKIVWRPRQVVQNNPAPVGKLQTA